MYSAIWVNSLITSFQHRHSLLQEQVIPRLLPIHIMAPKHTNDPVSRQDRKAKKRKLEDAVPDLPGDNDNDNDNGGVALEAVKSESEERMSKKARKEEKKKAKKLGNETGAEAQSNREGEDVKVEAAKVEESETKVNLLGEVEAPRKSKKESDQVDEKVHSTKRTGGRESQSRGRAANRNSQSGNKGQNGSQGNKGRKT